MLTAFQWVCFFSIIAIAFAGGYMPLFHLDRTKETKGFPFGEAFASGVFLALSLTMMLPAGFKLFHRALPDFNFPTASLVAILSFLALLSLEHFTIHLKEKIQGKSDGPTNSAIPLIMTLMIAIPSFFMGVALGASNTTQAVFIFIAILAHKGSASFALALKMVKSSMTKNQVLATFCLFAFSTPAGLVAGEDVRASLTAPSAAIVKAIIFSLAAGVFLYMSTLHELRHTPLIETCCSKKGFMLLLAGFIITAIVRLMIGEAHHL